MFSFNGATHDMTLYVTYYSFKEAVNALCVLCNESNEYPNDAEDVVQKLKQSIDNLRQRADHK